MVGSSLRRGTCHSMPAQKQDYTLPGDSVCDVYGLWQKAMKDIGQINISAGWQVAVTMSENGGLLSVATKEVVELQTSEDKCLFDSTDQSCSADGDVKQERHKQLDGQTNGCNGLESCENCYTDSGISNSADMDICSMELLDDSEANGEDCTSYEENQMIFAATEREETPEHKYGYVNDAETINVGSSLCCESNTNGKDAAETVLSQDLSGAKCTDYDGNCKIDRPNAAECSHGSDGVNIDDTVSANDVNDSVPNNEHSAKGIEDDSALDVTADKSCGDSVESKPCSSGTDKGNECCPNSADNTTTKVENLPADKSVNEGTAVETGAVATLSSAASSLPQSQPTFTTSRSVPRSSRPNRPRMGSYGSPPPSATPSSSCPDDDASKQQYIVNVHVNPGETFSVCVSDQVQLIQGT